MTPDQEDPPAGMLCSELSARRGLPLVGSAGCYDAILAFELPPPWTARLSGSRASDAAVDAAMELAGRAKQKIRVLALEPESAGDSVRVLWMTREPGAFRGFSRSEYLVPRAELAGTIEQLASGQRPDSARQSGAAHRRDVLVCTHGARDACCGKFGYPLFLELRRVAASHGGVRVWRTSHLGGHRFAPTLLDLPSGRMFGRVTLADAAAIVAGGDALVARLPSIYRGRCVLPEAAQIVERNLWIASGAGFEAAALSWTIEKAESAEKATGAWNVDLRALADDRREWSSRACVSRDGDDAVTTPSSCGRDPEVESPWKVVERA